MQEFIQACRKKSVRVRSRIVGQLTFHVPNVGQVTLRQGEIRDMTRCGIANLKASAEFRNFIANGDIEVMPV